MQMFCHGGRCCGISHLYLGGNSQGPSYVVPELAALTQEQLNNSSIVASRGIYTQSAPKEPLGERVKRMIRLIETSRSSGIIEAVLPESEYSNQYAAWDEFLKSLGFKEVTVWKNSNSRRMLHIYHRCSGSEDAPPIPPEKKEMKASPFA